MGVCMKYRVKKTFIERNGKVRKKGSVVDIVDVVAEFYEKNNYIEKINDEVKIDVQKVAEEKVETQKRKKNAKTNS